MLPNQLEQVDHHFFLVLVRVVEDDDFGSQVLLELPRFQLLRLEESFNLVILTFLFLTALDLFLFRSNGLQFEEFEKFNQGFGIGVENQLALLSRTH